jgi:hypothetical protein
MKTFTCGGIEMWQPIATAPANKVLLLFAVTDRDDNGTVRNWKMATGFKDTFGEWAWPHRLSVWELTPTHWQPLPEAPNV